MAITDPRLLIASWDAALRAQGAAHEVVRRGVAAIIRSAWARITDFGSPVQEERFAFEAAEAVRDGRRDVAEIAHQAMKTLLTDAGLPAPPRLPRRMPDPREMPIEETMRRGPAQTRFRLSQGDEFGDASRKGLARAESIGDTDLALAAREASRDSMASAGNTVIGWRRFIRPELSQSGTCGLCIAAATRVYNKAELMPLHANCKCVVGPVLLGQPDMIQTLNGQTLEELYAGIGETERGKLSRARFKVVQHGELGPLLMSADARDRFAA